MGAFDFFPVIVLFLLTYGIYKRSRLCALLLFVWFVNTHFFHGINSRGIIVAILYVVLYGCGVVGTLVYQHEKNKAYFR